MMPLQMFGQIGLLAILLVMGLPVALSGPAVDNEISFTPDYNESFGPLIIPRKSEVVLKEGQNFTIRCKGRSKVQFKQQEVNEEGYGDFAMVSRSVNTTDPEYEFETVLDLFKVDIYAIGYYACFDETVDATEVLIEIEREPENTEHISYIYVYVEGESLLAPFSTIVIPSETAVVIRCRPTSPDVQVSLNWDYDDYSPKVGFIFNNEELRLKSMEFGENKSYDAKCVFKRNNQNYAMPVTVTFKKKSPEKPKITRTNLYFMEGDTFSLNCTIHYEQNDAKTLTWKNKKGLNKDATFETNANDILNNILYNNLTIRHATKDDAGTYECSARALHQSEPGTSSIKKIFLEQPFIKVEKSRRDLGVINTHAGLSQFAMRFKVQSYPEPIQLVFFKNNVTISSASGKYTNETVLVTGERQLHVMNVDATDTGKYTLVAYNGHEYAEASYELRVKGKPKVNFVLGSRYEKGSIVTFKCVATGYPLPTVKWILEPLEKSDEQQPQVIQGNDTVKSMYEVHSNLKYHANEPINVSCTAENSEGSSAPQTQLFLVNDIRDGFGIMDSNVTWFVEGQTVTLTCIASVFDFDNISWLNYNGSEEQAYKATNTSSHIAKLKLEEVSLSQAGVYTCVAFGTKGERNESIEITVSERRSPKIIQPAAKTDIEAFPWQPISFTCLADAVPIPEITWYKDGKPLTDYGRNITDLQVIEHDSQNTLRNSTIVVPQISDEDGGEYECVAISDDVEVAQMYTVKVKEKSGFNSAYLSIIAGLFLVLVIVVVSLSCKIKREKMLRKQMAAAGLLNFEDGAVASLNPQLGVDEQADLLPYNKKFEFPFNKLTLGKILGAGNFGIVYKAEARGIIDAEETTTVAVKTVKPAAENIHMKALASELKILIHLGRHVNIVNLLGACSKNIAKRELYMIVEYCKFGSLENYLKKHREVFIDQLTDNQEQRNTGRVNRGFSKSSTSRNSSGMSDYFGNTHTGDTDTTFLESTGRDSTNPHVEFGEVSQGGYLQATWQTNYDGDYSQGASPRPLTSQDLLAWSYQIARGMEYLASRKVMHGDLAARNVLLAEDNVVKICDFGLARSIYKNDEYQKSANDPLPVKWLAIECITDRIFTTQSDIWSFGVVLWELFSLGKTPYPDCKPNDVLAWLSSGKRLAKPRYSDERLHELMLRCWHEKPTARPSFHELQEILGSFLEHDVREHYLQLNESYLAKDGQKGAVVEDYLAMMTAPDYNNVVIPSPHYHDDVEKSFFPITPEIRIPQDEEGYLQMRPATQATIFSPRAPEQKFDFDARKFNSRSQGPDESRHPELTPMLTLNDLPARGGSDSDHEGAAPYLNMCDRIDEEDCVFEPVSAINARNTAVSNPTYATYDEKISLGPKFIPKKPIRAGNGYVNCVNALVK